MPFAGRLDVSTKDEHTREIKLSPAHLVNAVCEECIKTGSGWVHLRMCLVCGHIGCCDTSPNKHAREHYHDTHHPIMQSIEPTEDWQWCYAHNNFVPGHGW